VTSAKPPRIREPLLGGLLWPQAINPPPLSWDLTLGPIWQPTPLAHSLYDLPNFGPGPFTIQATQAPYDIWTITLDNCPVTHLDDQLYDTLEFGIIHLPPGQWSTIYYQSFGIHHKPKYPIPWKN
jgi:hypothetical protein